MQLFSGVGGKWQFAMPVAFALLAAVAAWLGFRGSAPPVAHDFEACTQEVQAKSLPDEERGAGMTSCSARFAGRRKAGGGYSYYDFMQDRSFDIAGPNPTPDERKQIDREYMAFLDAQRREMLSAGLAKRRDEQLRAQLESARQPIGPPMVLTPVAPHVGTAKRTVDRSKSAQCEDDSLSCSWEKLSAAVKNAFASSSSSSLTSSSSPSTKPKPQ